MKLKERSKMKRLIAIVLGIALLSPSHAQASDTIESTFLKIVSGSNIEMSRGTWTSRENWTEIGLGLSVCRQGIPTWLIECGMNARKVKFSLVDSVGRNASLFDEYVYSYGHGLDIVAVKNISLTLIWRELTPPISLKAQFYFDPKSSTVMQTFYYPLNVQLHPLDRAKEEAAAKAAAELKAKQEAEAKAIAEAKAKEAELKAKQEAEARDIAEAKAKEQEAKEAEKLQPIWSCTLFPNYNKMTYAEASKLCPKLEAEAKAKEIAAERANAEAFLKPFLGKSCKVLGNYKVNKADPTLGNIKCVKVKGKKVWGKLKLN